MGSAIEAWRSRVETHHAQSIRTQQEAAWSSDDFWKPLVSRFEADPARADDPVLERLAREVDASATVLDVGGGAGKYALPLARRCQHVTVVEPSESMISALSGKAEEAGVGNLSIVQGSWEEVEVEPADVVLCAHVVYGVTDLEPFIQKLEAHARRRVLLLTFMQSPPARLSPLWQRVHGQERIDLPALPELMNVLWEMDIAPDLEMVDESAPQTVETREAALQLLRHFLYVRANTDKDRRLQSAVDELLVETPQGFAILGDRPRREGLISWSPRL
jgi:SAM-dependent methyltransferase